jgi:hypothetical protein
LGLKAANRLLPDWRLAKRTAHWRLASDERLLARSGPALGAGTPLGGAASGTPSASNPVASCWSSFFGVGWSWGEGERGRGVVVVVVSRGALSNFLGCSLDPFPFASAIKCHQKSTCNSAGSSIGSLAPPPRATRPPTAGRCGRVVPVLPLLLCTRPARACPSVGWGSTPPSRSALAPVESPSPGLVLSPVTALQFEPRAGLSFVAH